MSNGDQGTTAQTWLVKHAWKIVMLVLGIFGGAVSNHKFRDREREHVSVPVEVEKFIANDLPRGEFATGWAADPSAVATVEGGGPPRMFGATPAGQVQDLPKAVYHWKGYEALFARPPPCKNQNPAGTCVSFGTNTAIERTLANDIVHRNGQAAEFSHFAEEVTYAGSRIEVGKGQIKPTRRDPNGDGSVGAWAKEFVTKWGMVPRQNYPGVADLTTYSASRARAWGHYAGDGVPAELEAVAKKFPVKDGIRITNWADAKRALASLYGVSVCSNFGFNKPGTPASYVDPQTRDSRGVCRPIGTWDHCMALDGYHTDENGKEYGHIENSWGPEAHKGPVGWGNPTTAGFWVEASVIDKMLGQGDSWAYSGATGFPARRAPDFFIRSEPKRERNLFESPLFALAP